MLETAPDELYHPAAPTFVPASWKDPAETMAHVAGATGTLLKAAVDAPNDVRVLVASSGEVFGAASESPQTERTAMRPRSPYGVAKHAAFGLVDVMRRKHGLHASSALAADAGAGRAGRLHPCLRCGADTTHAADRQHDARAQRLGWEPETNLRR